MTNIDKELRRMKLDILLKEWDHCQTGIRGLESIKFKIRAWTIAILGLITGFFIKEDIELVGTILFLIIAPLWFIDGIFSEFANIFINRTKEISEILRGFTSSSNFNYIDQIGILHSTDSENYEKSKRYPLYDTKFEKFPKVCVITINMLRADSYLIYLISPAICFISIIFSKFEIIDSGMICYILEILEKY